MKFYSFIIFLVLSFDAHSQLSNTSKKINIWENIKCKDVKNANSELTIFLPDSLRKNGASIIVCPGGSYCYLDMNNEGQKVAKWLNTLGFTVFVLKYRVGMWGNKHPAMIQDLQRSIQIVRENCSNWKIKSNSIGVMGFSAGGHLVGMSMVYGNKNFMETLGIDTKVSLMPNFGVMVYPVISMHDSIAHKKSKRNLIGYSFISQILNIKTFSKDLENQLSLEDNVNKNMPPIFLVQTRGDKKVNYKNSLNFNKQLEKCNVNHLFLLYECEGHGFGIDYNKNKIAATWIIEFEKWFHSINLDNS